MRCSVLCMLAVMVAALITGTVSLPPDFFRAGRGFPLPPHKKSVSTVSNLVSAACSYCSTVSPALERECRRSAGEHRRACTLALLEDLQNVITENQWPQDVVRQ